MKKIKLKARLENAFEAFFVDEKFDNDSLSLTNSETNLPTGKEPFFSETTKKVFSVFRQIFLFLPGNFVLFFISVVVTGIFILRPFGAGEGREGYFRVFVFFLIAALATVFGLGNWRNPKHYLIPVSTISVGITLGIIGSIIFGDYGFGNFIRNYVPYFFPLAFIAPILMKSWLDKTDE